MAKDQPFHIYVGTKLIATQWAKNEKDAIKLYAWKTRTSQLIYHAKLSDKVHEMKQEKTA